MMFHVKHALYALSGLTDGWEPSKTSPTNQWRTDMIINPLTITMSRHHLETIQQVMERRAAMLARDVAAAGPFPIDEEVA